MFFFQSNLEISGDKAGAGGRKSGGGKLGQIQADSPIKFMQLTKGNELSAAGDVFEMGLSQALGTAKKEGGADFSSSKLNKVRV